jgi:hypothetical protein
MSKRPAKPTADAAEGIPERILLFCVASDTDWEHAGIQRDAGRLWLTKVGRAVLAALLPG